MPLFKKLFTTGLMSLGLSCASNANAKLTVGDPAPQFELPGSDGKTHNLQEMRGKVVVLAWFPKAFTSG